jgi:hypothetical protein
MAEDTLADQPGPAPTPSAGDRRAGVRHRVSLETFSQPGEGRLDQVWWPATVCDLSKTGIGLVVSRRFEAGTLLAVELQSSTDSGGRKLLAHVRHAVERPDGWLLGCAFTQELTDQELAALLP